MFRWINGLLLEHIRSNAQKYFLKNIPQKDKKVRIILSHTEKIISQTISAVMLLTKSISLKETKAMVVKGLG